MLKIETEYFSKKENKIKPHSTPKMTVMGKLMDKDEKHRFVVLTSKGVTTQTFKGCPYPKYSYFVKIDGDEREKSGLFLNLSKQAKFAIEGAKLEQFDVFEVTKGMRDNKKTGAIMPVVIVKKIDVMKEYDDEEGESGEELVLDDDEGITEEVVGEEFSEDEKSLMKRLKEVSASRNIELTIKGVKANMEKFKLSGQKIGETSDERVKKLMELEGL